MQPALSTFADKSVGKRDYAKYLTRNGAIRQYFHFTVANQGAPTHRPRGLRRETHSSRVRIDVLAPAFEWRMTVGMMAWKFRAAKVARSRSSWR
jgi:hypothetical protein